MASSALVAILSVLALGLLAPSASAMTLAKHFSVSADSSSNATAQEVNLALNVLVTLPDVSAQAQAALETLKNNTAALGSSIQTALGNIQDSAASSAEKVQAFLDGLREQVESGAANLTAEVQAEVEAAIEALETAAADAQDQINAGVASVAAAIQAKLEAAAAEAQALKATIRDGLTALSQKVNSSLTLGLSGLKGKINDAIQKLNATINSGAANEAIASVGASLGGRTAAFGEILEAFGQALGNGTVSLLFPTLYTYSYFYVFYIYLYVSTSITVESREHDQERTCSQPIRTGHSWGRGPTWK